MDQDQQLELNEKLFSAIILEDIKAAEKAILDGADINATNNKGSNALSIAVGRNKRKSFAWLLANNIDASAKDNNEESIVHILCKHNKVDYLKHLLKVRGPVSLDLDAKNAVGLSPLHYCCMNSHVEAAKILIESGADVNIQTIQGTTPVLAAVVNYNFDIYKSLFDHGANLKCTDFYKKDLLINAVSHPKDLLKPQELESLTNIVKHAIEQGLDPSYVAPGGMTPIFAAIMYGQKDAAKSLIEAGANVNVSHNIMTNDKVSLLHLTFEQGDAEMAGIVLSKITDPAEKKQLMSQKNSEGNTPSSFAFFHEKTRVLALDNEADVNAILSVNREGEEVKVPVVVLVINSGDSASFDAMVSKGVNLDFKGTEFEMHSPLKLAMSVGLPDMVSKVIKTTGINLNDGFIVKPKSKTSEEKRITPLAFLAANSQAQILESFLAQKQMIQAMLNKKLGDGSNANRIPEEQRQELQAKLDKFKNIEAELKQNKEVIFDMLLTNGADINHKMPDGKTAVFYCSDKEYLLLMLQRGADFFSEDNEGNIPLAHYIKTASPLIEDMLEYAFENGLVDNPKIQSIVLDMVYTAPDGYNSQNMFLNGLDKAVQEGSGLLNYQDADGNSALIVSCATAQAPVANFLIAKGADVNLQNSSGESAIMHAIAHAQENIVELLISKGADVFAQTKDGKSVEDFAREVGNTEILKFVLDKISSEKKFSNSRHKAS